MIAITKSVGTIFQDAFGDTIPEAVNASHNLVVVASDLNGSSERIISCLSEERGDFFKPEQSCELSGGAASRQMTTNSNERSPQSLH